ncbi:UvrD/REP helicase N-terminal domain-containing protein [Streptosporangium subroseum]|uniref:DNA 3'-5' helicase n=1 Tax=Streptosporangium subroseum TaxID=106412 RepID=A0A239N3K8_9ACTN|nr:UvrD-helicase domain-containing protein [Streptosporangium subroseum]SNT48768.1 UvrD/REP helicase N-terminal domain-containing protein [Streptosporangium subroseum]
MARLGVYRDFFRHYLKLEKSVQDQVIEVFSKFGKATYAGLHLEPVKNARDGRMHTIRITDFWRGVVLAPEKGDLYVLLNVLQHDKAYEWAKRRQVTVNTATGVIEMRDLVTLEEQAASITPEEVSPLFAQVKDADLERLGIDAQVLAFARTFTSEDQLDKAQAFFPKQQHDVLVGLASGMTVEEVWASLPASMEAAEIDAEDVAAAVERSPEQVLLVSGPDELMDAFAKPFAFWRIYLHPSQRDAAYSSFSGPARVTGGPGTGKTVVALHRAKHLAEQSDEAESVLVTTFIRTLPSTMEAALRQLIDDDTALDRIEVRHIDGVAYRVVTGGTGNLAVLRHEDEKQRWTRVIRTLGLPSRFDEAFLSHEWRQVILTQGVTSLEEYQQATRPGRGRALGHLQKGQIWDAITAFTDGLRADKVWTYETICQEATRLLEAGERTPYRHVIVDEAQDLSPWHWRLLRAATTRGRDDLFLAGDTHQRVYDYRVSLKKLGIDIAGRSTRLKINYRTTAEILRWSLELLRGERIDDMNGGLDSLAGYRSEIHGAAPLLDGYPTQVSELEGLVTTTRRWLDQGVAPGQVGVAARSNILADQAVAKLKASGIPAAALAKKHTDAEVGVGTMHRMKGMEFRCVAIIGVGEHAVPPSSAITPADEDLIAHHQDLQQERCLLFVAATRAREELTLSWHGAPSRFLSA